MEMEKAAHYPPPAQVVVAPGVGNLVTLGVFFNPKGSVPTPIERISWRNEKHWMIVSKESQRTYQNRCEYLSKSPDVEISKEVRSTAHASPGALDFISGSSLKPQGLVIQK